MMGYHDILKYAEKLSLGLRADHPAFRRTVYLLHEEGTTFLWRYAFALRLEDWWLIFTEHHGTHVYHESDIAGILQFAEVQIAETVF